MRLVDEAFLLLLGDVELGLEGFVGELVEYLGELVQVVDLLQFYLVEFGLDGELEV